MINYNYLRSDLQTGDIVFFSSRKPVGRFIQLITKGHFNHVGLVVRMTVFGVSRVFVLEETPEGRRLSNMSDRAEKVRAYRPPPIDPVIIAEYINETGRPYSFWNALIAGLNLPRALQQTKRYICSQMVAEYLYDADYNLPDDNLIHPNKLEKICSEIFEEL